MLERLLADGALVDRMLTEDGFVERLVSEGGTLEQLIALGTTVEEIQPRLLELTGLIPSLETTAPELHRAVGPLGELAARLPLPGRKPHETRS